MPNTLQRQRQELELCGALGSVLQIVKGFAAREAGRAYDRARELWELLGSPPEFIRIHYGQSTYYAFRGEFELAHRLDDDLLRLSEQRNDRIGLIIGHTSVGRNLYAAGRLISARSHQEAALALYDPASHRAPGIHIGVPLHGHYGNVLIALGFLDKAFAQINTAIAEARAFAHAPSLAASLMISIHSHWFIRDLATAAELTEEAIATATELGFPHWRAQGTIFRGWARFKNGDVTDGIALLRSGLGSYRATGAEQWVPCYLTLMAGACGVTGQFQEGLALLDEAAQIVKRTGERVYVADLNQQKGELLLRQGRTDDAERSYCTALSIAHQQEAKLWELRAAVSLARLRRDQGRGAEAHDLLAPIYEWFTEGLNTPALKEAKALLDELA